MMFLVNIISAQSLYINEFLASNDSCCADEKGEYDDWIEIYNAGSEAVDIGGMFITDDLAEPTVWQIPTTVSDSTTIPAGGYLVLWADKKPEQGILHINMKLSGKGEQIGLFTTDTVVVDTLTYSAQQSDTSYGRTPDGSDNWKLFVSPTPGATNVVVSSIDLYINEFLASNDACCADEKGEYDDWIEIYNAGSKAVDIGGMFITDDLTDPTVWQIPIITSDSTLIPAGGFLVLWADKKPEQGILHINLKLSGKGEQIGLFTSDTVIVDTLTYTAQLTDTSYGRLTDGGDIWGQFSIPSIGETNTSGTVLAVEGNNILSTNFVLNQNYPNPFNPETTIQYSIPIVDVKFAYTTNTVLKVYNILGKEVATLVNKQQVPGNYSVVFDASNLSSGIYYYQLKKGEFVETKKMILLK